jgi:hypothetical protein
VKTARLDEEDRKLLSETKQKLDEAALTMDTAIFPSLILKRKPDCYEA